LERSEQVRWWLALLAVAVVGLPMAAQAAVESDSIRARVRDKSRRYTGRIVEETPTSVKLQRRSGAQTFKLPDIETITYAGMNKAMRQAFLDLRAGGDKLREARKGFDATIPAADAAKQKFLRQALEFGLAEATARLAAADPTAKDGSELLVDRTIELLHDFRRSNPDSRHHYPLFLWLGRMYTLKGDAAKAEKAFATLGKSELPSYRLLAEVQRARIYVASKEFAKALAILDKVVKAEAKTDAEQKNVHEAIVLRCQCLQAGGKTKEAIAYLDKVIRESGPTDYALRAKAHNTLGDCHRATGEFKEALLNYLSVDIIYAPLAPLALAPEHAKALYNIAQCWDELSDAGKAKGARQDLRTKYPRSPYTKQLGPSS